MQDLTRLQVSDWSVQNLNQHILTTDSAFVLLIDEKVVIQDSQVNELLNRIKNDTHLALVQPKITVSDFNLIHPFGGVGGFVDRLGVGYTLGAAFGDSEPDMGQYDTLTAQPDWIFAPVMIVRREAFELACGLDTDFDGTTAWMDFGARLRRLGFSLVCYSSLVVSYPYTQSNLHSSDKQSMLFPKVSYVIRHSDGPWVLVVMMWLSLEFIYLPGNLIQLRFKLLGSRLRALCQTIKHIPDLVRDRYLFHESIETVRYLPKNTQKRMFFSVFWNHYARLGKTASNLLTVFLVIASVFSLTMRDRR